MRIGERGSEVPVVKVDDTTLDARGITDDFHPEFFAGGGVERLRVAVESGALPHFNADGQRVGAPLVRPGAVICIGMNYAEHAAESGSEPPTVPVIFFKHPNTIIGPDDQVRIPRRSDKADWEVELAIVIGKEARYIDEADALDHIAGYAISNDVSERTFQLEESGGQWSKGKCCEDFNPLGPALVVDEIDDPQTLGLRSWVNGEERQNSTTADMIFSCAAIVSILSQYMVLSPGDVINTGTPQGVALSGKFGYLKVGDVMEIEIDQLGRQRQELIEA